MSFDSTVSLVLLSLDDDSGALGSAISALEKPSHSEEDALKLSVAG